MNGTHLPNATYQRRCADLYNRFLRCGIRPAWIEPRVVNQAQHEAAHNLKSKYEAARKLGERPTHAEPKPHPLIAALRQPTF